MSESKPIFDPPSWVTKDSGKREDYPTGMRRDTQEGKPRFDLLVPLDQEFDDLMLTRWAGLMARGAQKYGERNWEKAATTQEYNRFKNSAFRHFMQWLCGVKDGEDHAAAIFFNVSAAEYVLSRKERSSATQADHFPHGMYEALKDDGF